MEVRDDHGSVRKAQVFPEYNAPRPRGIVKSGKKKRLAFRNKAGGATGTAASLRRTGYARLPSDSPEHRRHGHHSFPGIVSDRAGIQLARRASGRPRTGPLTPGTTGYAAAPLFIRD